MRTKLALLLCLGLVAASPSGSAARVERGPKALAAPVLHLTTIAGPLSGVTGITHAGDDRLFITLQNGQIVIWDGTQVLPTPFLDVSELIVCCGEQGLLSTAFHPSYATNGFFFVYYTDRTGRLIVARYKVSSGDPNVADAFSGVLLLTVEHENSNHNGGQLQFGPDGQLYAGLGDGGSGDDPPCHAQRMDVQSGRQELLGKMLRLDVNQSVDAPPYYGIPAENPFVATGGPDEAWAIGLRNPWRFSFDRLTGDLVIGDVGQGQREEIDFQAVTSRGGQNYGWKIMEGTRCTGNRGNCPASTPACFSPSFTPPILEYGHDSGRCSVTGGYVYRGLAIPDLYGTYLYGDYCSGEVFGARPAGGGTFTSETLSIETNNLATFGEDSQGELYIGTGNGFVYRIDGPAPQTPVIDTISPAVGYERGGETVRITGANFTGATTVLFGSIPVPVTVISPTVLTVLTPPGSVGLVPVTVANPGAPAASRPDAFAYVAIPRVEPGNREPRVLTRPATP